VRLEAGALQARAAAVTLKSFRAERLLAGSGGALHFLAGSPNAAEFSRKVEQEELRMAAVEEKVKQIVSEQLGVDEGEVTPSASFVDDLGADSLDVVELVMAFEEAFDIEIPDEDAEKIKNVQDAIDYINKKAKVRS